MTNIQPQILDTYQPGAILVDSWGWEQTNIDFYCIVARKGDWLTVLPMKKHTSPEIGFMTNEETPLHVDHTAKPIRKKVKAWSGQETGFSFRNYSGGGWCSLWKGKPVTSTHYA